MRIYINKFDATKGVRGETDTCPVARVMKRKLHKKVEVSDTQVDVNYVTKFVPSKRLADMINRYDNGAAFVPGHYSLRKVKNIKDK